MKNNAMTKQELIEAASKMTGGDSRNIQDLTVTQFVTDLCLNELEYRGELVLLGDTPLVPYVADHMVETV
jgi:hypothetical protein